MAKIWGLSDDTETNNAADTVDSPEPNRKQISAETRYHTKISAGIAIALGLIQLIHGLVTVLNANALRRCANHPEHNQTPDSHQDMLADEGEHFNDFISTYYTTGVVSTLLFLYLLYNAKGINQRLSTHKTATDAEQKAILAYFSLIVVETMSMVLTWFTLAMLKSECANNACIAPTVAFAKRLSEMGLILGSFEAGVAAVQTGVGTVTHLRVKKASAQAKDDRLREALLSDDPAEHISDSELNPPAPEAETRSRSPSISGA